MQVTQFSQQIFQRWTPWWDASPDADAEEIDTLVAGRRYAAARRRPPSVDDDEGGN